MGIPYGFKSHPSHQKKEVVICRKTNAAFFISLPFGFNFISILNNV